MSETLITWAQRRGQIKHLLYELCLVGRIDKSTLFAQFYDLNNVEPIVRCKDCKHFKLIDGECLCGAWEEIFYNPVEQNGYCYKGERKDEVEE